MEAFGAAGTYALLRDRSRPASRCSAICLCLRSAEETEEETSASGVSACCRGAPSACRMGAMPRIGWAEVGDRGGRFNFAQLVYTATTPCGATAWSERSSPSAPGGAPRLVPRVQVFPPEKAALKPARPPYLEDQGDPSPSPDPCLYWPTAASSKALCASMAARRVRAIPFDLAAAYRTAARHFGLPRVRATLETAARPSSARAARRRALAIPFHGRPGCVTQRRPTRGAARGPEPKVSR